MHLMIISLLMPNEKYLNKQVQYLFLVEEIDTGMHFVMLLLLHIIGHLLIMGKSILIEMHILLILVKTTLLSMRISKVGDLFV